MKLIYILLAVSILVTDLQLKAQECTTKWTTKSAKKWIKTTNILQNLKIKPNSTVNIVEFATQYSKNPKRWEMVFEYLKRTNLDTLSVGKYPLDGENLYVSVNEGTTKEFEASRWESHHKYIDLQYVVKGKERMGIAHLEKATEKEAYNEKKDVAFYTVLDKDSQYMEANPVTFFLFFPTDVHRPDIKLDGCSTRKKIVFKIKAE